MMLKILCFTDYYLPGFRAGGPVKTISNFVEHLGDEFEIQIITRDRDVLDYQSYKNVQVDCWNIVGKAKVFYCSKSIYSFDLISKLLVQTQHDILYLNSFFSIQFTILPLLARKLGILPRKPCVIAPRGELSRGALAIKTWKKRPYLLISKFLSIYKDLHWQASSELEKKDICEIVGQLAKHVSIASDVPSVMFNNKNKKFRIRSNFEEPLKLIYFSRISPMKNLDFLLRTLVRVKEPLMFSICGPLEDRNYWSNCEELIGEVSDNVDISYLGEILPRNVQELLGQYDLFVLPTRGENYGHVVLESLCAGTPVLLSDRTSWKPDQEGALEVLPLIEKKWCAAIESWSKKSSKNLLARRLAALKYARTAIDNSSSIHQNKLLFKNLQLS